MANTSFQPRTSLRDIAKLLGLSHVAVSLALRGSPRVSSKRREEVKQLAEKMGYRPDPMLVSLVAYRRSKSSTRRGSSIGWINQWSNPDELRSYHEFDHYWQGACEAGARLGYHLEEFRWPKGKSGRRLQIILQARGVRGLLIPPHREGLDLPDFDWNQFSLVRFGSSVSSLPAHTVTSNQAQCCRLAYEKAHALGYRRIGYVSEARFEQNTCGHFREGYLHAQQRIPAQRQNLNVLLLGTNTRANRLALRGWLQDEKPDAVITTSRQFRSLALALKLRIPEDIAVVATSVLDCGFEAGSDQNQREIGSVAVSTLAGLILENERGLPAFQRDVLVAGRWVDGASLPPKAAPRAPVSLQCVA